MLFRSARPSATNTNVPRELDDLVLQAVAPNPAKRYATASELVASLRAVLAVIDARTAADDASVSTSTQPRSRYVLMGGLVGAAAVAIWWFTRR